MGLYDITAEPGARIVHKFLVLCVTVTAVCGHPAQPEYARHATGQALDNVARSRFPTFRFGVTFGAGQCVVCPRDDKRRNAGEARPADAIRGVVRPSYSSFPSSHTSLFLPRNSVTRPRVLQLRGRGPLVCLSLSTRSATEHPR